MSNARHHAMALLENPRLHARTRTALLALPNQAVAPRTSLDIRRSHSGIRALRPACEPPVLHCLPRPATHQHYTRW